MNLPREPWKSIAGGGRGAGQGRRRRVGGLAQSRLGPDVSVSTRVGEPGVPGG